MRGLYMMHRPTASTVTETYGHPVYSQPQHCCSIFRVHSERAQSPASHVYG